MAKVRRHVLVCSNLDCLSWPLPRAVAVLELSGPQRLLLYEEIGPAKSITNKVCSNKSPKFSSFMFIESHRCIDLSLSPNLHRSQLTAHLFLESLGLVSSRLMQLTKQQGPTVITAGLLHVPRAACLMAVFYYKNKQKNDKNRSKAISQQSRHHVSLLTILTDPKST